MALKKFKEFKIIGENVLEHITNNGIKIEVKKNFDQFAVLIDGTVVENFKVKQSALDAVDDAIEAIESNEE